MLIFLSEALFSLSSTTDDFFFIKLGKPMRVGWRFQYYATGLKINVMNECNEKSYVAKRNGLVSSKYCKLLYVCCVDLLPPTCHDSRFSHVS